MNNKDVSVEEMVRPWLDPRKNPTPEHQGIPVFLPAESEPLKFVTSDVLSSRFVPGRGSAGPGYYSLETRDAYRILRRQIRRHRVQMEKKMFWGAWRRFTKHSSATADISQKEIDKMIGLEKRLGSRLEADSPDASSMPREIQLYTPHTSPPTFYDADPETTDPNVVAGIRMGPNTSVCL